MFFDDQRLDTIWQTLRGLRGDLCRSVGGELYDEIWYNLVDCAVSIEEDLARLKELEK